MTFDTTWFFSLYSLSGKSISLDALIILFAEYIPYLLGIVFLVVVALSLRPLKERLTLLVYGLLSAGIGKFVLVSLIRYAYHRPRPFIEYNFIPLIQESSYSFPSGHATFFFALSTAMYIYNRKWGVVFLLVSALIAGARVIAGVHYPLDVVAGALLGFLVAFLITPRTITES